MASSRFVSWQQQTQPKSAFEYQKPERASVPAWLGVVATMRSAFVSVMRAKRSNPASGWKSGLLRRNDETGRVNLWVATDRVSRGADRGQEFADLLLQATRVPR